MSSHSFRAILTGLILLTLLLGLSGPALPPAASAAADKIEPALLSQPDHEAGSRFLVVLAEQADLGQAYRIRDWEARGHFVLDALRAAAGSSQPAVLSALDGLRRSGHVSAIHPHYIVNLIVVEGDREAIQALSGLPEVAAIYADRPIVPVTPVETRPAKVGGRAPQWNIQIIRADQVWSSYGITGTGIVVANIDSGVDYDHPALVSQYRGNMGGSFEHDYNWWDPSDQYDYPNPIQGPYPLGSSHGTHTMGIIVGDDGVGNQIGVAPGAQWIAAYGFSGLEGLLSASEWMIAPWQVNDFDPSHPTADPAKRPHTVNNSWGAPGGFLLFQDLLEVQRAAGIFATFAAGNNGFRGCGTMISPADNPAGFAVGATGNLDTIAPFSSRGPNALRPWMDRYGIGPDLSAPGWNVLSSHPGGSYSSGSGTSYASPHVAGVVALLWAAEPDLLGRVEETAEILRGTAVPKMIWEECGGIPGSQVPNNTYGWGRMDALAAVDMIWQAGTLSGTVSDAGMGDPLPSARVSMQRSGYTLTTGTDTAGRYNFPLGQGSYTVTVRAYGYELWTQAGVDVQQDLSTTLDVSLTSRFTHTLSGLVAEGELAAVDDPVWAQVGVQDTPVLTTTDPAGGTYRVPIAEGDYTMRVTARGYHPESHAITVTGDLAENFTLSPRWTYYVRDSRSPCGPAFDWIDATDGVAHYLGFQRFFEIQDNVPSFTFYENTYSSYYVSSNGFVSFGQGYPGDVQDLPTMVIPFEGPANNAIYGFGEMLNPDNGQQGVIYHKVVDDRYLVIEFHQVEHWVSGDPETFEFILDSETGAIVLQYLQVGRPDWVTVGVENHDGSEGLAYATANSGNITDSLAVAFYPIFGPPPAEQDDAGVWGTLSGTVYVSGTASPIPGAVVTASSFLRALSTTADAAGRYHLNVCADLYGLQADAPGYNPSAVARARLRWAGDVVVSDLFLEPGQAIPVLSKTVAPTQVRYGELLTFSLSLLNEGGGPLLGATLYDELPWSVAYSSSTPPGAYRDGVITWTIDLTPGGSTQVNILCYLIPPPTETRAAGQVYRSQDRDLPLLGDITNTAYLFWEGPAISASASFDPVWWPGPPPELSKAVTPTQVYPGERVTYTLAYQHWGGWDIVGAVLSDVLPLEVVYLSSTPPGVYRDGVITWTLNISAYAAGGVTVIGRLSDTAVPGTTVDNGASLNWWQDEPPVFAGASFDVLDPGCQGVQGPAIAWAPSFPLVGQFVVFSGTVAAGDAPITFTWDWGDGGLGVGPIVGYTYTQAGSYTVVLTVTNCGGAEMAVARATVPVQGYRIYLPLLLRSSLKSRRVNCQVAVISNLTCLRQRLDDD